MANTYPSLLVKGMIYIHSGSRHIFCRHKKSHKGDVVDQKTPHTLHAARKYVWVRWCMICLNPKCTTSMGHQLDKSIAYDPELVNDRPAIG